MSLLKYGIINNILHCSTEVYPLGPLYQHIAVLHSNICIRKVIAETGTRKPFNPRRQEFATGGTKEGVWGRKSPSGVQEQSPGEGLGRSPQKQLGDKC